MTTPPRTVAEDELLLQQHCPGCGYRLSGLAPRGACPECGQLYHANVTVLFGSGAGMRGGPISGSRGFLIFWLALVGLQLVTFVQNWQQDNSLFWVLVLGIIVALIVTVIWKRFTCDMPGLVQVHLSPAGACQLDKPRGTPPPMVPWDELRAPLITRSREGVYRLRLRRHRHGWLTPLGSPVDVEFRATAADAEQLRERIASWRGTADDVARDASHDD